MASMASLVLHSSPVARFHVNQASIAPRLQTPTQILFQCRSSKLFLALRSVDEGLGSAAGADSDSVVSEVAALPSEEKEAKEAQLNAENGASNPPEEKFQVENGNGVKDSKSRRPSVLQRGGTLTGDEAAGKDPNPAALGKKTTVAIPGASFSDPRWRNGNWDLAQFTKDGKVDWDAVIDAEVRRRKWLEEEPEASSNSQPVVFETSMVPWWAWVKRFHLPEAELLNGRAAMVGFFAAYLVDAATGIGLVDQMGSFLGKLLLFITVVGILLIRKNEDATKLKTLADEWTFYDKQWQATWKDQKQAPTEKEQQ